MIENERSETHEKALEIMGRSYGRIKFVLSLSPQGNKTIETVNTAEEGHSAEFEMRIGLCIDDYARLARTIEDLVHQIMRDKCRLENRLPK